MHKVIFAFCFFSSLVAGGQHRVTWHIKSLPSYHKPSEAIYLAGSFNNWNPAQQQAIFEMGEKGAYSLTFSAPKGKLEYKITRGSWETVESGESGLPLQNRILEVTGDTIVPIDIQHWADHFPKAPKKSTASSSVKIISTNFYVPQLDRYRRIWIYLPKDYNASKERYPVLYMHDGQNVFEDSSSFSGEWGVDEALDSLQKKWGETIVIAIDNGGAKRLNEYSPYDMLRYGKGEGDAYVDFLVHTLRPFINKHYRTKKQGRHNYIAGSSMGGLISFYALLKYPKKWGGAGVFSPAFWIAPDLKAAVISKGKKVKGKVYFFAGQKESETMVPDMLAIFGSLHALSKAKLTSVIRSEGKHDEATWRKEFPLFYKWLMAR